jgi:hypothetical protein
VDFFNRSGRRWLAAAPVAVIAVVIVPATQAIASPRVTTASTPVIVANWAMNDGSDGVMHDSSGHGNNGTLENIAASGSSYGFPLKAGRTSRVVIPDSQTLDPEGATFKVSMRVSFPAGPDGSPKDFDLIRKGQASDGHDWKIEILKGNHARCFAHGTGGSKSLASAKALSVGKWHTIVCTFTPTGMTIVVDGSRPKTQSGNIGSVTNDARVSIGAKVAGTDPGGDQYAGQMKQVVITKG